MLLGDRFGARPSEHDEVEQGVGAEAIGSVDAGRGVLAAGVQTWDHLVAAVVVLSEHLKVSAFNCMGSLGIDLIGKVCFHFSSYLGGYCYKLQSAE